MEAARAAAKAFVARQPAGVIIGVIAFSDGGVSVQVPTRDQSAVLAAIDRLQPQQGTSLGQGINAAVHTIEVALNPPPTDYYSNRSPEPTAAPTPVPAGVYAPAVVVLLSDGENNENPDPLGAAQAAADRGIRIDTVAIGSPAGVDLDLDGFTVHTQLNKDLLDHIAATTGGTSNEAADSASLLKVYDTLDAKLTLKSEPIEVTGLVAGLSLVLLVVGGLLSLRWLGRLP
jgi:Ca-activated chloride channel homolog